jgi:4-amino-4-deoxy-L-arabinose transferase-like glycosyltransferase
MSLALEAAGDFDIVHDPAARRSWWREWPLAVLALLVLTGYFSRLTTLPIRGEESRRGLIAREMIETGDWIIPRTQGVPLFSRPPLQNWIIAVLALVRGDVDAVAMRLPSVCAILLTCLVIYRCGRMFLSPLGAFAAGAAFASMGQVLELGRVGETDALFTFFFSGALLCWHAEYARGRSRLAAWCTGYALAALGTLTKGPQAPVYFVGPVCLYLASRRDWRTLFSRTHLASLATFSVVLAIWQAPCLWTVGFDGMRKMYVTDVGHRFIDASWFSFGEHLAVYPLELAACLLPWSVLLIVWFDREFRRTLGRARDAVLFLAIALAVSFPTVWFPPGSRPRYFMSLYPCVALLVGLAVERVSQARPSDRWRFVWPLFVRSTCGAMLAAAAGIATISVVDFGVWLAQPAWFAIVYAAVASGLAFAAWRSLRAPGRRGAFVAVGAIALFVGFSNVTVLINALSSDSVDTAGMIEELKRKLPRGTNLVSFEITHHLFAFHYRDEIPVVSWPADAKDPAAQASYFCADVREFETKELPFPWTPVAEISCDRHKLPVPRIRVVVGRRQDVPSGGESADQPVGRVLAN